MDFVNLENAPDPKQGSSVSLVNFVHTVGTQ